MKLARLLVPFLNDDIALPVFQGMCGSVRLGLRTRTNKRLYIAKLVFNFRLE